MKLLIFNALVVIGVWESTAPGMILEKPAAWLESKLGRYWVKPLFNCPPCMASVWGTAFYFLHDYGRPLWYVLALAGLIKLILKIVF